MNEKIREDWKKVKIFFHSWLQWIPLVSGLRYASGKDYAESGKEFAFTWTVSILPILASVLIELLTVGRAPSSSVNLLHMFYANLHTGEVFIYATAILAPVAFMMYKYNRDEKRFDDHLSFFFVLIVTIGLSAVMFGLQRTGVVKNPSLLDVSGLVLYLLALVVWFLSLIYDNVRLNYNKAKKDEEDKLFDKLHEFEGGAK